MTVKGMIWDLAPLVESTDPAVVQKKLASMVVEAERMREIYHGKICNLSAKGLYELLEVKDAFSLAFEGVMMYCGLMYAADATSDVAKQLNGADASLHYTGIAIIVRRYREPHIKQIARAQCGGGDGKVDVGKD